MSNNQEDPRLEAREIERLKSENAILRSLIHEKVQCTNCSADESVRMQLEENQKQLAENQKKLSENQVQLAEHQKQLDDSRNQIEALRAEMADLKVKQQADMDANKIIIEKLRVRISKLTRDKQAKDVQMNPVVECAPKTEFEQPVPEAAPPAQPATSTSSAPPAPSKVSKPPAASAPSAPSESLVPPAASKVSETPAPTALSTSPATPASPEPPASSEVSEPLASSALSMESAPLSVPPKPKSLHEKFAGVWKIASTKNCEHYINFQKLDKDEYLKDLDFECDGKYLQIPPEPEVVANPYLTTETRFDDNNLLTVLRKDGAEKIDDIVITRYLKSDDQMVIKTVVNAFYNLTLSRQVISCTRVYYRAA